MKNSNNDDTHEADNKRQALDKKLGGIELKFKRRFIIQTLINAVPFIAILNILSAILPVSPSNKIISVLLFTTISIIAVIVVSKLTSKYRRISRDSLLFHLNRKFPALEESAQLLLYKPEDLNSLQAIQLQRVKKQLASIVQNHEGDILPKLRYKKSLVGFFVVIVLAFAFSKIVHRLQKELEVRAVDSSIEFAPASIETIDVTITPPGYSRLAEKNVNELDLKVLTGSLVHWKLVFSSTQTKPKTDYFIEFSDGQKVALNKQADNSFTVTKVIEHTGVYRILSEDGEFTEIHTINVVQDKKPIIRIVSPKKNISEIAKDGKTEFVTRAHINDDFEIAKVEILASVAKGSGESVKFRDQTFAFDSEKQGKDSDLYSKKWDLKGLGMEPGDELYFTVTAWDNKAPFTQNSRSTTKVIRWLEEEQAVMISDGILIDFMPEYFKSQRQIIIETKELIEDKEQMTSEKFVETSELLGVAQSSLKEKYGQYLGDEFESGEHAFSAEDGDQEQHHHDGDAADHEGLEDHDELEEHEKHLRSDVEIFDQYEPQSEEHQGAEAHSSGHEHSHGDEASVVNFEMQSLTNDRSGMSETIARFGHNHGDADIGIMAKQDPKALMKRSIANMWQAELHLMLSQPEKALPFEQEALKYLKLAKKADRIYVKRLGFEPPPVSEERRYQGELDDILTYQKSTSPIANNKENEALAILYRSLGEMLELKERGEAFDKHFNDDQQEANLLAVKNIIQSKVSERPALVKYQAMVEEMLLNKSLVIKDCIGCTLELREKIWQLMLIEPAQPYVPRKVYADDNELIINYGQFLEEQR